MIGLLTVVFPVFLVLGAGALAVRTGFYKDAWLDPLMAFAQRIAIPCLLFNAALNLDLATVFNPLLLLSFYAGATISFFIGILGARLIFNRRPGEAVAIGFGALFSNSVTLGLPIIERAYGADALAATFAIVAIHAPFCYFLGITSMEISRADGQSARQTAITVLNAMLRNALMVGIGLGFICNFIGLTLPGPVEAGLAMIISAALPTALFALGGVLTRYAMKAAIGEAGMVAGLSLILHPAIAYLLAQHLLDLPAPFVQAAVMTAAMAPGINTYVFSTLYRRAEDVAAATVLLSTILSVLSVSAWLAILG